MNRLNTSHYSLLSMFRWQCYFILSVLALGFLTLPQSAQAVSPAPDGGYPGFNTAEGQNALLGLTAGQGNTAVGWFSLRSLTGGSFNTATGAGTLLLNTADENTAFGAAALLKNSSGGSNTAVGTSTLSSNTTGSFNEAMGVNALASNDSGFYNIAIGDDTLSHNVSGSHNIIVGGFGAGFNIVAGSNNIYIGSGVSANGPFDESDAIRINDSAPQVGGTTSKVFIDGIMGATVGGANVPVIINANGQLGTGVSSARFKKDIDPIGKTSEAIFSLKPVTFHYKGDKTNIPQFGLIAEEVEKVSPDLVVRDKEGKPYSVRYEQVNAMLLNEFLNEHKTVQELKNEIAELITTVKEQSAQIQKVSARLEVSERRSRTVLNDPQNDRGR